MKKFISVFLAVLFALSIPISAYANDEPQLIQAVMNECDVDIFLSDDLDEQSLSVKVATTKAEIIDCGLINETEILIRTTILVDISNSVPIDSRDEVTELVEYQVENITENEEMRILTFGNEVNTLQEFTSDRYDLYRALEQIVYNGTQSAVYDAIYNTIPELNLNNEKPCFYRTIIVTDGADHAAHGITKEELLMKLQSTTYPIDVICVSKAKPKNPNKDLSALTRISNGRYFEIYPDSDVKQLYSELSVKEYYWIRASIPHKYLDGSIRQVDVQDDRNHVNFDIKMSVVDYDITDESVILTTATEKVIEKTDSMAVTTESTYILQESGNENAGFTLMLLIVGGVAVLSIIIVTVVCLFLKKRSSGDVTVSDVPRETGDTEVFEESPEGEIYVIKISDAFDAGLSWNLNVPDEIIIGREDNCDIVLTDRSVSHQQCKITAKAKGLTVQNLSASNHTKLNGNKVNEETLLHSSDTLRFGRVTLKVDSIQKIGADEKKNNKGKKRDTEVAVEWE